MSSVPFSCRKFPRCGTWTVRDSKIMQAQCTIPIACDNETLDTCRCAEVLEQSIRTSFKKKGNDAVKENESGNFASHTLLIATKTFSSALCCVWRVSRHSQEPPVPWKPFFCAAVFRKLIGLRLSQCLLWREDWSKHFEQPIQNKRSFGIFLPHTDEYRCLRVAGFALKTCP
jgi:hypothetical protein